MNPLPPAIFLMGPTAAGKTDLAVELVQRRDCEIISVDSALIYRDMNIGSAKPDAETLALAPHHLINIRDAAEAYSAAEFRRDALLLMQQITLRGKVPLLVGGTMMYYKALMEGLAPLPESEPAMRAQLEQDIAEQGLAALHARLCVIDPVAGARINATDPQRITRAMEVYLLSGETLTSHWQRQQQQQLPYNVASIGVWPPERAVLHRRIERRFEIMLQQGFEAEVATFMQRGDLNLNMPSMRCVGYRQMWQYLAGEYDYATMEHKGIVATRQLAKRQLTWLRSWPDLQVFDSLDTKLAFNVLQLFDRIQHS
ncbi:MAG TPA: tRNA (adenosine(37)-N6)-dimethylallyltransferase MiaA [Oceanospirillaceae bacterium]|nr:tRNA (adenosine(37)-N6)-dimethylallyltransferase MiaA [Oceanospirillaceae bacterium]